MTMRLRPWTVSTAVMLVAGAGAGPADAVPRHAAPLVGSASGTVRPGQQGILFAGEGHVSRLGRVANLGVAVITGPDRSCPGGLANINTETLTTPSGDSLTLRSVDVACPTGPGRTHGAGTWTVTAGSGRFEGATGQGTAEGDADFAAGTFVMNLDGWVSIPG
jgi:hypothetical protein